MEQKDAKQRIWLISNMKTILIIFVVFGHMLPRISGLGEVTTNLRIFIWMFHMPAFLFISGFLSKNLEKCRNKAIQSRLLPYVVMTLIVGFSRTLLGGKPLNLSLVVPVLTAWYFLVLFWYALFTPEVVKMKYPMAVAVVVALGMGCIGEVGDAFAFSKAFAFFPFYLAGYYCTKEHLLVIRRLPKITGLLALAAGAALAWWFHTKNDMVDVVVMFSLKSPYHELGLGNLQGMLYRGLGYVGALLLLFALIQLTPAKQNRFSYIGDNTLVIYSFHLAFFYLIDFLKLPQNTGIFAVQMLQVVLATVVTVLVLAVPAFNRGYSAFLNGLYRLFLRKEKRA